MPRCFMPAHMSGAWFHIRLAIAVGVKSRSMRRPRSGARFAPRPLTLWQRMHCSVSKSCSPRRASPKTISAAGAIDARTTPAAITRVITRTMDMAGLLLRHPDSGDEGIRPESIIQVKRLAETVILPLGVPGDVLAHGQRHPCQRLVVARRRAAGRNEHRSAQGQFAVLDARQRQVDEIGR